MVLTLTVRELRDYILALGIVKQDRPLLALDTDLTLWPEIDKLQMLLKSALQGIPLPRRGQKRVSVEVPEEIQTQNLNKALRYGLPAAFAIRRSLKKPTITQFESAAGIAYANKLVPGGAPNDYYRPWDEPS